MGSPDIRQIDGIGGGDSLTSQVDPNPGFGTNLKVENPAQFLLLRGRGAVKRSWYTESRLLSH
jgi:hypothetical protein